MTKKIVYGQNKKKPTEKIEITNQIHKVEAYENGLMNG